MIKATKDAVPDCWDAMCKEAEQATSVEIKSNDILAYIASAKFDDGKWRGMLRDILPTGMSRFEGMSLWVQMAPTTSQMS